MHVDYIVYIAACHDIDQWPAPVPGETLHLPIMGCVLQLRMPQRQDKPGSPAIKKPFEVSVSYSSGLISVVIAVRHLPVMGCVLQLRMPQRQDKPGSPAIKKPFEVRHVLV